MTRPSEEQLATVRAAGFEIRQIALDVRPGGDLATIAHRITPARIEASIAAAGDAAFESLVGAWILQGVRSAVSLRDPREIGPDGLTIRLVDDGDGILITVEVHL